MAAPVADRSSNKNEQIVHAAEVIGRSDHRARVFRAVYEGKKRTKTVLDLMAATGLIRTRVLDAGKALASNDLVEQTKADGVTAYEKVEFIQRYRDKILRFARNKRLREAVPTKRSGRASVETVSVAIKIPRSKLAAIHVTVDGIDSFEKVRTVPLAEAFIRMPERTFKEGTARILGERSSFSDWGGELRDLSSTRLRVDGKRCAAALAFKGPGTSGRLTPAKCGKNGDQIQRLLRCPAEVFLMQYWGEIDDSVLEQLEKLTTLKAYLENRRLWYGIIDGQDSARLIRAYKSCFPKKFTRDT